MVNVQHREVDVRGLTRLHGGRVAQAAAKFGAHHVAAHKLLKSVIGISIDDFDDPIGVRGARGDDEPRLKRTDHRNIVRERSGLIRQDIRAVRGKSLILSHVVRIHVKPVIANKGDRMVWIANIFVVDGVFRSGRRERERASRA